MSENDNGAQDPGVVDESPPSSELGFVFSTFQRVSLVGGCTVHPKTKDEFVWTFRIPRMEQLRFCGLCQKNLIGPWLHSYQRYLRGNDREPAVYTGSIEKPDVTDVAGVAV